MNKEELERWINLRKQLMFTDGESAEFVGFAMNWFRNMKGKDEISLLQEYHPALKSVDSDTVLDFIHKARYFPENFPSENFALQVMDSAFFLYRPALKMKYLKEEKHICGK
jgi:hypothetical protein